MCQMTVLKAACAIFRWRNGFKRGHSHIHGHIHNRKDATWEFMRTRHNAYNAGRIGDCKIRQIIIYYPGVRRTKICVCVV